LVKIGGKIGEGIIGLHGEKLMQKYKGVQILWNTVNIKLYIVCRRINNREQVRFISHLNSSS